MAPHHHHRSAHQDHASAETMGTMIVIGVLVAAIGAAAADIIRVEPTAAAPKVIANVEVTPGLDAVLLTRTGGDAVDLGELRVLVTRDAKPWAEVRGGTPGVTWGMGETLRVMLPGPVDDPSRLSVTLAWGEGLAAGAVVADMDPRAWNAPSQDVPGGPRITPLFVSGDAPLAVQPTQNFLAQVRVDHDAGRKLVLSVTGHIPALAPPIALLDDGQQGDAHAGDGVHSAFFTIPLDARAGRYPFVMSATDVQARRATGIAWIEVMPVALPSGALAPADGAPPRFTILPEGGVTPLCDGPLDVWIVGSEITYGAGGPPIPVRVEFTQDGGASFTPLYGGRPVQAGDTARFPSIPAGAELGTRGSADLSNFHARYDSMVADPHVYVLKDGDAVPDFPAFDGQRPLEAYLAPYVDGGWMVLQASEVIVLYEFNRDLNSDAADFQDLVVMFSFPAGPC